MSQDDPPTPEPENEAPKAPSEESSSETPWERPTSLLPSIVPRVPQEGLGSALDALAPLPPPPGDLLAHVAPAAVPAPSGADAVDNLLVPTAPPAPESADRPRLGLLSTVLSQAPAAIDAGAQTALRSIPRRSDASRKPVLERSDPAGERGRAQWLEHLAEQTRGGPRARLLCAAAELWQRRSESGHARSLYEQAHTEDPSDPIPIRELRRRALSERNHEQATLWLQKERELGLTAPERALCSLLLAELALARGNAEGARREAERSFEDHPSVAAGLTSWMLQAVDAPRTESAERLRRTAELCGDAGLRAALLCEAGRVLARADAPAQALPMFERALSSEAAPLEVALYGLSAALATHDHAAALRMLPSLRPLAADDDLRRAVAASIEAVTKDAGRALAELGLQQSLAGLRMWARLSERIGDLAQRRRALTAWLDGSTGAERALPLLALAELDVAEQDFELASQRLHEAAASDPALGLVRIVRAALVRAAEDPARFAGDDVGDNRLDSAARVARSGQSPDRELELLRGVTTGTAALVAIDAAAELGKEDEVAAALERAARTAGPEQRPGLLLALAELERKRARDGVPASGATRDKHPWLALHRVHEQREPADRGRAWLELSALLSEELASTVATLGGDLLRASGGAIEAYERALAAAPGSGPPGWALEALLDERQDRPALRRLQDALARATRDPFERACRLFRAAELCEPAAESERARRFLELASIVSADALLHDRLGGARGSEPAEVLERVGYGTSGTLAKLAKLRAATRYEDAGEPARAAALQREVLAQDPLDPHAALGLTRSLTRAGLRSLLFEQLERTTQATTLARERREAHEQLAALYERDDEERRAREHWKSALALDPDCVTALRALQRDAMQRDDAGELAFMAERLARRELDPRERSGQQRLHARARAREREPGEVVTPEPGQNVWQLLTLEQSARVHGDALAISAAVLRMCEHIEDPEQRGSYALRAAQALQDEAPERAEQLLAPFADAAKGHSFVHEALGNLRQQRGDLAGAAGAYEQAALGHGTPARSARLWYRAALLFAQAGDDARARRALEAIVERDVLYRDAFERLRAMLEASSDVAGLCRLLERRAAVLDDDALRTDLHVERARLLLAEGKVGEARDALHAALSLAPNHEHALRTLADLQHASAQWTQAADTLIRVARVSSDSTLLREVFLKLGRIYEEHLPDLRRAEIAYGRAVGFDPNDATALERLISVLRKKGEHDKARLACERWLDLAQSSRDPIELDRRTVVYAQVLLDLGQAKLAERALNDRRETRPDSPAVLSALTDLYSSQNDEAALTVHLDRSVPPLRKALLAHPENPELWGAFVSTHLRRGKLEQAERAAKLASDLGLSDGRTEKLAAGARPLPIDALSDAQGFLPGNLGAGARALLGWLEVNGASALPAATPKPTSKVPPELERARELAGRLLGEKRIELVPANGVLCVPCGSRPLVIRVGNELVQRCDESELAFLLIRAGAIARLGLSAVAQAEISSLRELIEAAAGTPDADPAARERIAGLSARAQRELTSLFQTSLSETTLSGVALHDAVLRAGNRAALALGASLSVAVSALAACLARDDDADYEEHDVWHDLEASADARDLLEFGLSDAYLHLPTAAAPTQ